RTITIPHLIFLHTSRRVPSLWLFPGENDCNRASVLDDLPCGRQLAGVPIDLERDNGVALFVCRVEKTSGGIEPDEAWCTASGRLPADDPQQTLRISLKNGDAVMAPVGAIDETAIRRYSDLGSGAVAREVGRQR